MLVLSRRIDQSIMIDDDIKITVVGVRGNQHTGYYVKIGIEAPKERQIDRLEIYKDKNGRRIN